VDRALYLLIGSSLVVQGFVHYFGQQNPDLRFGNFYFATALARTVVPLACVVGVLRIPLRRLGFGVPRISKRDGLALTGLLVVGTAIALLVLQLDSYQGAYRQLQRGSFSARLSAWALFTLSATVPWELFHRGFLLHGVRELCTRHAIPAERAATLAILFTACFEVIFHFSKPPEEAIGMLIGSPILSVMAFRFRSLWVPLLVHLWIELLWFLMVWL